MPKLVQELVCAAAGVTQEIRGTLAGILPRGRALRPEYRLRQALLIGAILAIVAFELRSSTVQAKLLSMVARDLTFSVQPSPSEGIRYPSGGPYDRRHGYATLPAMLERLEKEGFRIEEQADWSPRLRTAARFGLFPIYREKPQAGLTILDRRGAPLYSASRPERIYWDFESIPPLVAKTLLFVENREALDADMPHRNPAIEWSRLGKAVLDVSLHQVYPRHPISGGSTLATQLEKIRHSPEGRTPSPLEKLRQIASASLRSYQDGPETLAARKRIVRDYLNSLPLSAAAGHGEVLGLGDGLWVWYGADFDRVNVLLAKPSKDLEERHLLPEAARSYREVLSLILAANRPSFYLRQGRDNLNQRVDAYLRLLAEAGILSPKLRDAALKAQSEFRNAAPPAGSWSFAERKGSDAIRVALLAMLGVDSTYELDQLDLAVESGFDKYVTDEVAQRLRRLASPSAAAAAGVTGHRLLNPANDVSSVFYSFSLYERSGGANYLRAQVDTFNGPLNVNEGTKLELGSTAKLRTLVTYLETVARLHANYAGLAPAELQSAPVDRQDRLTRWAIDFMAVAPDKTLPAMLESAMNRIYSASPDEAFFTGGGVHLFSNFEPKDNARVMTVREAFQRSVNLVFIRLMRDLAYHYRSPEPGLAPAVLADERHPLRRQYLERFADREGREFLARFYRKYRDLAPQQALDTLLRETPAVAYRLAAAYRFLEPDANPNALAEFLAARLPAGRPVFSQVDALYRDYAPGRFHLNDAGFLARVHPLELWTAAYLRKHPGAGFDEILRASERERQEAYAWLFKPGRKQGQDIRILSILEADAFQAIHRSWKRQGYPFATLVPSYATAIGSSGDTPAALAELAGIIVNGGVRYPASRFERLHFAQGTPFETVVARRAPPPERVLAPEVAAVLRQELLGVVERGTARRAYGAVALNDGTRIAVGGKTGTGDNRLDIFGVGGAILESRPMNRTATFVFTVGDRFFGTVVAYVPGPEAGAYQFTSALPLQVFRDLVPAFLPLVEESERRAGTRALTGG